MFIVSETGSYHFSGAREPHLVEQCTEQCKPAAVFTAMEGSTIGLQNSGGAVEAQSTTTIVTFDSN